MNETHNVCDNRLKKEGGKATCCECNPHDDCSLEQQRATPHTDRERAEEQKAYQPITNLELQRDRKPDKESWEEEFDERFIIPESHFGKDYYNGNYRKEIWGKYQDGHAIKDFIQDLLTAQKKEIVEMCGGMKKKVLKPLTGKNDDKYNSRLEEIRETRIHNQALDDIINKLKS